MNRAALPLWLTPIAFLLASSQTMAASSSIAQVDSFRIGSAGVVCTAQNRSADPLLKSMFDRAFSVVCQDAASSVGKIYKIASRKRPFVELLNWSALAPCKGLIARFARLRKPVCGLFASRLIRARLRSLLKAWPVMNQRCGWVSNLC
jgi:hypothetical protein